jgi:hypothetical protein
MARVPLTPSCTAVGFITVTPEHAGGSRVLAVHSCYSAHCGKGEEMVRRW